MSAETSSPVRPRWIREAGFNPLLRKLTQDKLLSVQDEKAILGALTRYRIVPPNRDVLPEGPCMDYSTVLLDGFMCRCSNMRDGKRQILSFLIPGDLCDLTGFFEGRMDHVVATLTACTVCTIAHRDLARLIASSAPIRDALWREVLRDAAIYRAWITRIGRRSAYERLAHLFCEIALRLEAVGMKKGAGYEFSVTQADLSDALGLSAVHVNRMLQQLRNQGLITFNTTTLAIHNWDRLQEISGFNAAYLSTNGSGLTRPSGAGTSSLTLQPPQSPLPEPAAAQSGRAQGLGTSNSRDCGP